MFGGHGARWPWQAAYPARGSVQTAGREALKVNCRVASRGLWFFPRFPADQAVYNIRGNQATGVAPSTDQQRVGKRVQGMVSTALRRGGRVHRREYTGPMSRRLLTMRDIPKGDSRLLPGKLAGCSDSESCFSRTQSAREQRWWQTWGTSARLVRLTDAHPEQMRAHHERGDVMASDASSKRERMLFTPSRSRFQAEKDIGALKLVQPHADAGYRKAHTRIHWPAGATVQAGTL